MIGANIIGVALIATMIFGLVMMIKADIKINKELKEEEL